MEMSSHATDLGLCGKSSSFHKGCIKLTTIKLQTITYQLVFWQLLGEQQNQQFPTQHSQQQKTSNTMQVPAVYQTHHSIDPVNHNYTSHLYNTNDLTFFLAKLVLTGIRAEEKISNFLSSEQI